MAVETLNRIVSIRSSFTLTRAVYVFLLPLCRYWFYVLLQRMLSTCAFLTYVHSISIQTIHLITITLFTHCLPVLPHVRWCLSSLFTSTFLHYLFSSSFSTTIDIFVVCSLSLSLFYFYFIYFPFILLNRLIQVLITVLLTMLSIVPL